jgi:hypothetical protein
VDLCFIKKINGGNRKELQKKGYNIIGGNKNKKKNSSWKLNHVLVLVSVFEMLARPPTTRPMRSEALASGR